MIYLDNSATTRPLKEVASLVYEDLQSDDLWGNPGSLHELGTLAYKSFIKAKEEVASCLHCKDQEIYFTSCATESANMAISGYCKRNRRLGRTIISTHTEHKATLEVLDRLSREGFDVIYVSVDSDGKPILDELDKAISDDTILLCFTHVNNETGSILPIEDIIRIKDRKNRNIAIYLDCVQSVGKIKLDFNLLRIDMASFSGHKIHSMKGVGALYVRNGTNIEPFILGGGQQSGMRSGTESVTLARAFAKALTISTSDIDSSYSEVARINEYLRSELSKRNAKILSPNDALPFVLNVSFDGFESETMLHCLERYKVYVSTISACSSKSKKFSYVLEAMGVDRRTSANAIRLSFSRYNTMDEAVEFIRIVDEIYSIYLLK